MSGKSPKEGNTLSLSFINSSGEGAEELTPSDLIYQQQQNKLFTTYLNSKHDNLNST